MDAEFKQILLAGLLKETDFLNKYRSVVIPEIFSNPVESTISEIINLFYDKYHRPPTFRELRYLVDKTDSNEDMKKVEVEYLASLESLEIPNLNFVIDEVIELGKVEVYRRSILEASELFEYKNVNSTEIKEVLHQGDSFGEIEKNKKELNFSVEGFEQWIQYRNSVPAKSSGFNFIDRSLHNGGFVPGNFMLVIAGAKMGKSAFLIDASVRALRNNLNVLYITLEIDRFDTMSRFISNAFNVNMRDIKNMPEEIIEKIKDFKEEISSNLTIVEYPSKALDVPSLHRRIKNCDSKPDIVVVDYCMLMKPLDFNEARFAIGSIPSYLRGVASEEEVVLYSAWQTNRGGWEAEIVGSVDIAESSQPVMDVDMVVTLSPHENSTEERRLLIAKVDRTRIGNPDVATILRVTKSWRFVEAEDGR